MTTTEDAVVVFTGKSPEQILSEGGSQAWKLDPSRAKKCTWLVCTQNAHNYEDYAKGNEPHGSAFLVGRISRVSPAPEEDGRWMIEVSEYARMSQPNVWTGDRNPVRYTNLGALGINLEGVEFQKMERDTAATKPTAPAASAGLTIAQAKAGLAETYGVAVDSIEIVIRG
ncbi:hypothetical protein IFM12275_69100 (plasmid) [Nocardia sputorum]|uniref:hypothetical protein n=1 Tax=Nocardia sputorum TaxID=2984338 RepID=UPI00249171CC|nr:hypothetical protein [Nocardia sputorum]BDT96934.1 hypothetical protein IFM12275_69100 [Nocardia sputorum]